MKIICPKCGGTEIKTEHPETVLTMDEWRDREIVRVPRVREKDVASMTCQNPDCGYRVEWEEWKS